MTWLTDTCGNRCAVEYYGTKETAQAALDSLKLCKNCTNCSNCTRCTECIRCVACVRCMYCSDCTACLDCVRCIHSKRNLGSEFWGEALFASSVPVVPHLHRQLYAAVSSPGALDMQDWHTCENTHCRAGWVVTLAGAAGKVLEARLGTELAALLIYDASCPNFTINPARLYDNNTDALADIRHLADLADTVF